MVIKELLKPKIKGYTKDSVRDLFARLRGASKCQNHFIVVKYSNLNFLILDKFYEKGWIASFEYSSIFNEIKIFLKPHLHAFDNIRIFSKISRKVYKSSIEIPRRTSKLFLIQSEKGFVFF